MHPKLLIVDDDQHTRDALKRTLQKDFEIILATSGEEALERLSSISDIAIILSDERMPGMSGVELLTLVKKMYPKIMRVILSGQIELEGMMRAVNMAAVHRFVMKPWDNSALRLQLQEALLHQKDLDEIHRLEQLAITDPVTGLTNHRFFQERIREELDRSQRHNRSFSLLMIDVDYFKAFNDKYGHPAGDQALFKLAQILKKATRLADTVSRYGGEEFTMILPETLKPAAMEVAERIRSDMENTVVDPQSGHVFTFSIGVATYPLDANDAPSLITKADKALYQAKQNGRNKVEGAN